MKQQSITSLPPSPEAERRSRMIKYTIAMSIRVLCIVAMLFVEGWWLAVCAAGAIFLPYFAVVLANVGTTAPQSEVLRPGAIVPLTPPASAGPSAAPSEPRAEPAPADDAATGGAPAAAADGPDAHDERGAA